MYRFQWDKVQWALFKIEHVDGAKIQVRLMPPREYFVLLYRRQVMSSVKMIAQVVDLLPNLK